MILLPYDGSADARAAIDGAARLMPGAQATVLTVWEPFISTLTRTGSMGMGVIGLVGTDVDAAKIDASIRAAAFSSAAEGAQRASVAGLAAQARSEPRRADISEAILAVAAELDADMIVLGTRGLSGIKSFLLGSVSHAVVQHADRAVMVVPSPALAEQRREHLARETNA